MAEKKEKQYVSDNARLMAEWDWERNDDINPQTTSVNSHQKVWWRGKCEHAWLAETEEAVA